MHEVKSHIIKMPFWVLSRIMQGLMHFNTVEIYYTCKGKLSHLNFLCRRLIHFQTTRDGKKGGVQITEMDELLYDF